MSAIAVAAVAAMPAATMATTAPDVSVPAVGAPAKYYTDTGIKLSSGQSATITASGTWDVCGSACASGPDGISGDYNSNMIDPTAVVASLVYSTDSGGHWSLAGSGPTTVSGPGELLLAANDSAGGMSDNTGSLTVTITNGNTTSDVTVRAVGVPAVPYTDTGINLSSAQSATITASGTWDVCGSACASGPDGISGDYNSNMIDPAAVVGSLVYSTDSGGHWSLAGSGPTTVSGPGELLLAANDSVGGMSDNTGSLTVSIAVQQATSTTLSSSANPSLSGQPVTLTATVSGPAGSTQIPEGTVTFTDGSTTLGTGTLDASGTATYTTSALATGTHQITATYGGDSNDLTSHSTVLTQTVNPDTPAGLTSLVGQFSTDPSVTSGLGSKVDAIAQAPNANAKAGSVRAFINQVRAQTGKALTSDQASTLITLVQKL